MSRFSNLEEDRNFMNLLMNYIKNEPAMFIEKFRAVLIALPALGVALGNETVGAIMAIISILVSAVAQSKGVRDVVTPYWKVEEGVFDVGITAEVPPEGGLPLPESG